MPRGYRCIIVAIVGWLSLAAAQKPPQQPAQKAQPEQIKPPPTPYAPYGPLSNDPCYRAKDHDTADLCAQWRAAFAAEKAAKAANKAVTWTIVGTLLSGLALVALLIALRQTERALAQARKSNRIAQDTAKIQLRAYVGIRKFRIENLLPGQTPDITYEICNFGQTPAYELRHAAKPFVGSAIGEMSATPVFFVNRPAVVSKANLGGGASPAQCRMPLLPEPITPNIYDAIIAGQIVVGVFGALSYRDIYKRRHLVTFKLFLPISQTKDGAGPFYACEKGNRSN